MFYLLLLIIIEIFKPKPTIDSAMQMHNTISKFTIQDDIDLYILSELNRMACKKK